MTDFSRVPLWMYGHSFTEDLDPGVDWEWMPKLAASLGSPSWQTFGVGSSRLIDVYGDISRLAPTVPQPDSAWPWDGSRRGAVILQAETNDIICPADTGTTTLPLSGKAVDNYQQTLEACLALLAAEDRWDWNYPTASGGAWSGSAGPMYMTGGNAWTIEVGAWRELRVAVGSSGVIGLITWDLASSIGDPTSGAFQVTVDGVARVNQVARTAMWQEIFSRRGGGYLHSVGPRVILISGLTPGTHTVRVTKVDGPGRVYLDQLVTLHAEPNPVLVTKDPAIVPGTHWATTPEHLANSTPNRVLLHGAINRAVSRFQGHVRAVSLSGIRPEHYADDGIHLSPVGMDWQASVLAQHLTQQGTAYEPDLAYVTS